MNPDDSARLQADCTTAGLESLRWVTAAGLSAEGGLTWPETTRPGARRGDDLYEGTASVLAALAQARLAGHTEFDAVARAAAGRLTTLIPAGPVPAGRAPDVDPGLYTGLSGMAAALRMWFLASRDQAALDAARAMVAALAALVTQTAAAGAPLTPWRDLIAGEAGLLLVLVRAGGSAGNDADDVDELDDDSRAAAGIVADRLLTQITWVDGQPDWNPRADDPELRPNFSHGLAGIGFALAATAGPLDRPDLLDLAVLGGQRLVALGQRPDGTLAVPHSFPPADDEAAYCYGWCHGPAGTLRLFELLDRLCPGRGWDGHVEAASQAVRRSGLPTRLYPGFWDNLGQCCGTAGVGEMALDRYQRTGDPAWLDWAAELAADVLARRIADQAGVRWSHTEHRVSPPELEPSLGFMQGAAGIGAWLLRLAMVARDGRKAPTMWWPDRP
ncbi:MAG: lanthionine synthetase LanC family protein [Streptosporangiaceae bacterium]